MRGESSGKANKPAIWALALLAVVGVTTLWLWMGQEGTTGGTQAEFPVQLEDSVVRADGAVSFTIPQSYREADGWQLHVAGRAVYADGFSQSLHHLEGEPWVAGKTYTIPVGEEVTELTLTAHRPGFQEQTIDLLG